jgi:hypothetical protein
MLAWSDVTDNNNVLPLFLQLGCCTTLIRRFILGPLFPRMEMNHYNVRCVSLGVRQHLWLVCDAWNPNVNRQDELEGINPRNAELNPICHSLILLGDLTFMVPCIVSIFQYIYPTRCNVTQYIYIWKLLYMFRVVLTPIIGSAYNCIYSIWYLFTPLLLSAAIVEELEPVWVCCGWRTPPTAHSNLSTEAFEMKKTHLTLYPAKQRLNSETSPLVA